MNKHHKQRIILFICSPIADEQKDIIKIAKKLKKEKVNIGMAHIYDSYIRITPKCGLIRCRNAMCSKIKDNLASDFWISDLWFFRTLMQLKFAK